MRLLKDKPRPKKGARERGRRGEGSLKLRGGIWWYIIPSLERGGRRIEQSCQTSDYQQAVIVKGQALAERSLAGTGTPGLTMQEVLGGYEQYCKEEKGRSWRSLQVAINHLRGGFGGKLVNKLATADIERYRATRVGAGVTHATANRELGYLKAALHREQEAGRVVKIPHVRRVSEKDNVREGFIGREEYERLLGELPASLKAIFVCAFHTGARLGELKQIRWQQVNWERNVIELRPKTTKNSEGRWIPIWGDMREYLQRQWGEMLEMGEPSESVFFWWREYAARALPGTPLKDFRFGWARACERAGLKGLLFHDLRRSAIRFADQDAGISPSLVMLMSGHKTDGVYRRYNIRGARDIEKVGQQLDSYLAQNKAKGKG